jgi:TonB family protein
MIAGAHPVYPKAAKRAHIQGVVKVEFVITKTGEVGNPHAISGPAELIPAAIAAVRTWRYAPCRVNGLGPIERRTSADVQFTLNQ